MYIPHRIARRFGFYPIESNLAKDEQPRIAGVSSCEDRLLGGSQLSNTFQVFGNSPREVDKEFTEINNSSLFANRDLPSKYFNQTLAEYGSFLAHKLERGLIGA